MNNKIKEIFGVERDFLTEVLIKNASAMGYLHGALSEEVIRKNLIDSGYEVYRIKEKPSGGFDSKIDNYKGDFLIKRPEDELWLVVESKGLKTNSEFRGKNKIGTNNKISIINKINRIIKKDNEDVYNKGYNRYKSVKEDWETKNPGKTFPPFGWNKEFPGPDSVNLSSYFGNKKEIEEFFNKIDDSKFNEEAFRNKSAAYYILETHKPSTRVDQYTQITQAAPLKTDFSILAVDLFQRYGEHKIVFADASQLSHSPTSPMHLYQNYVIDIIIPGLKDELSINKPWYLSIDELLENTNPRRVKFDETQIDYRE